MRLKTKALYKAEKVCDVFRALHGLNGASGLDFNEAEHELAPLADTLTVKQLEDLSTFLRKYTIRVQKITGKGVTSFSAACSSDNPNSGN